MFQNAIQENQYKILLIDAKLLDVI